MITKTHIDVISFIAYTILESLWAGWLVKSEALVHGIDINLTWSYLGCYIILNAFDLYSPHTLRGFRVALRLNNACWIIIATLVLWVRGVI
jgi:hypothetical protein